MVGGGRAVGVVRRVARGARAGAHAVGAVAGLGRGRGAGPRAHAVGARRPALRRDVRRGRLQLVLTADTDTLVTTHILSN